MKRPGDPGNWQTAVDMLNDMLEHCQQADPPNYDGTTT